MAEIIEITRTEVIEIAGEAEQLIITQPAALELVEVAQQGPAGPQGPQGNPGPAGPQGDPGPAGTTAAEVATAIATATAIHPFLLIGA